MEEKLQTIRFKPSQVAGDVVRLCKMIDSRKGNQIIIRKSSETLEYFVYFTE